MDFITQVTLGGAVGQATMHRELGNKAVLWGMFAGALPDLDILAYPLMDSVTQLTWHRGISHSILLTMVLTPLLGWLIARVHHYAVSIEKAALFTFLALGTHILIDLLTTYGTMIFEPFSNDQLAWNVLFIIDPLFTLPLLIFLLLSLLPGESRAKQFRNAIGMILAFAYVVVALLFKFGTELSFERALEEKGIQVKRMITTATPFNTILWRCVVEDNGGFWIGYRSLFDRNYEIPFWYVPRNELLLAGIEDQRAVQTLRWFSDGWFSVRKTPEGELLFQDLRFGEFDVAVPEHSFGQGDPRNLSFTFTFRLFPTGDATGPDKLTIEQDFPMPDIKNSLEILWKRIKGTDPPARTARAAFKR
ncbi:MAG: metal-dependent hydrolase [Bacteroidetes bacterium]|nr:metal-dependent hydrolase [Bacteroidota bacterium]